MRPVVLDSTAFYPYGAQRRPALERLFVGGARRELRLCIPEVVVREVTRHFGRKVSPTYNAFKDAHKAAKEAGTLPPEFDIALKRPVKSEVVAHYERSLRDDIRRAHGRVLPVPEIEHEWVLSRIFGPLKPSKADEDSYRDILIWKSVVALAAENQAEDVVFITNNTTDFSKEKGSSVLHPELSADLEAQQLHPDSVAIMLSPEAYVEAHLAAGDELRAELERLAVEPGNRHEELKAALVYALDGVALDNVRVQLPAEGEVDDLRIESINHIEDIKVVEIYDVGDAELVATMEVRANVDVFYAVVAPTGHDMEFAPRWAVDGVEAGAPFLMNSEMRDLVLDLDVEWDAGKQQWGEVNLLSGREAEAS